MKLTKRILKSKRLRRVACWIAATYLRFVGVTTRWRVVGGAEADLRWSRHEPFILAFWHGRMLLQPFCWRRDKKMNMLISRHNDGELIATTIGHFGLGTVRGSATKGGAGAMRQMLRSLKSGEHVGITPDGPRGPGMFASDGIVAVARLSGATILPCTNAVSRRKVLGSWDSMVVPLPFSRGVIVWGRPITVPREADDQATAAARQAVEDEINRITVLADGLCGVSTTVPARLATGETA